MLFAPVQRASNVTVSRKFTCANGKTSEEKHTIFILLQNLPGANNIHNNTFMIRSGGRIAPKVSDLPKFIYIFVDIVMEIYDFN